MDAVIKVHDDFAHGEGRFHRQGLIDWWDQDRLSRARVLVVGAGALGNEILKNLALVGVGAVLVADMDTIEHSNLARSVLFRDEDVGADKATVAARRVKALYPEMRVQPFVGNVVYDLGAGVFRWADIIVSGLDNREARVAVNRTCLRVGRPWIDGAIERLDGVARIFLPDTGACYECTMNETDWKMLAARRSCALLSREEMEAGRTPTTATTASIVAGFECQEMLKYLHGLPVEGGTGIAFNGQVNDVFAVSYAPLEDCPAHETIDEIVSLPGSSDQVSLAELLGRARTDLGPDAVLEFSREILLALECASCGEREPVFRSLGTSAEDEARCPRCGEERFPHLIHGTDGTEAFLERSPLAIGLPPYDIILARQGARVRGYVMEGDAGGVLGEVAPSARGAGERAEAADE